MKQKIRLALDARLLSINEEALKKVAAMLTELEEEGLIENGQIVFDDSETDKVNGILDKILENGK